MFDTLSIPVWMVILFGLFGFIGLLDRIIGPGLRWFFRRKANQAIEELNTRLQLRIQPFKTTKRQALIDQLLLDAEIAKAIEEHVAETGVPRAVALAKAQRYAREIVPAFNAYAYTKIGTRLARWASNFVYRVRLGYADDGALSSIDPDATVVFVMNHRSNMDYLLVTYLASATATLSYAVGEWARVWVLQNVIHAMGAYFIRRDSGNILYRRVLARYVAMATRSGVTQAIFPEGGLSRDGTLKEPRFGLLGYMIGQYELQKDRDVVFVPVGLNYDRVLEDRILLASAEKKLGEKTFQVSFVSLAKFVSQMIKLRFQGKLYRLGYACASFGRPISLAQWCGEKEKKFKGEYPDIVFANVEQFGRELMDAVGDVVPVLPVSLVATLFKQAGEEGLSELELKAHAHYLMRKLEGRGAHIHLPRKDQDYALSTGLRMLKLRHMIREEKGRYYMNEDQAVLFSYYANSIGHLCSD